MAEPDLVARTARVLLEHTVSLAGYQVMCSAGYRVTLPPAMFVSHAFCASEGDPRGQSSLEELAAALDHLQERGLMLCLTDADLREDAERRKTSSVPEVVHMGYQVGHVDFTHRGYVLYREAIRAIHGDEFLLRVDAGVNLDSDSGRFDFYAASADVCQSLMDEVQGDGDSFTGIESTLFVGREGPFEIGEWRPNRFILHTAGHHGVLRYVGGAAQPGVAADGPAPRR
jgi:hypothetical protein